MESTGKGQNGSAWRWGPKVSRHGWQSAINKWTVDDGWMMNGKAATATAATTVPSTRAKRLTRMTNNNK